MQGRKPTSPKVKDLAAGRLRLVGGNDAGGAPPKGPEEDKPPAWIKDRHARAEWKRLLPALKLRKQYIPLFQSELARYCVAFGQYVEAIGELDRAGGPVTKSSKNVAMLSQYWVVANRAHETMTRLAGDLGLNPVAQVRLAGLQLDLFQQPPGDRPAASPFGAFRRE
jgi:P27 family predicted phage terminase small subunit